MSLKRILAVAAVLGAVVALAASPIANVPAAPAEPVTESPIAQAVPQPEVVAAEVVALPVDGPALPGDIARGESKAISCAACHGVDGNAADPQYPNIAGQHQDFIARQLKLYKSGERDNAIMMGFASMLSSQDMRDLGAYFASQQPRPGVADETLIAEGPNAGERFYEVGEKLFRSGDLSRGIPSCAACHGPAGAGVPGPAWPRLAAQHAPYTAQQLRLFRDGMVWGEDDNANGIMASVARNLTDEEIDSLASYLQGLHDLRDTAPTTAAR